MFHGRFHGLWVADEAGEKKLKIFQKPLAA
jgi:hypothetical protein